MKIKKKKVILFFRVIALCKFGHLKTCHQDISKNIVARSFKHGQLVEDLVKIKKKSYFIFFRVIALCKFGHLKTCHQDISKIIVARSFKHGQLVEDDE